MDVRIDEAVLARFRAAHLHSGKGDSEETFCAVQWGRRLVMGPEVDPKDWVDGRSPSIQRLIIRLNDRLGDAHRDLLKPYTERMLRTTDSPEAESTRRWMAVDFACRVAVPIGSDAIGATDWAEALHSCPEVIDADSAAQCEWFARMAREDANAADAAAGAAAYAYAAGAAAYAAAAAAAYADDAAGDADAAAYADDAAGDADARSRLRSESLALLDRMLAVEGA